MNAADPRHFSLISIVPTPQLLIQLIKKGIAEKGRREERRPEGQDFQD
jgi:hypothetical protein